MAKLHFAVHGRAPQNQKFLSITDVIDLPEFADVSQAPKYNMNKYQEILNNPASTIDAKIEAMKELEKQQAEANKAYQAVSGSGGLSKQDQIRAFGIKFLVQNHGDEISLDDNPGKFLIKEEDVELSEDDQGDFYMELVTVFGGVR